MPTITYTCPHCRHRFQRVVFRGEEAPPVACPKCRSEDIKPALGPTSLFDGIARFSSLAGDTN